MIYKGFLYLDMFSIKIDDNIIKNINLLDIELLHPHEKVIVNKKEILKQNLKYKDNHIIISSIIVCEQSNTIIDGHHRYFALKELGLKKIPVTFINYFSEKIKTDSKNSYSKYDIIENAKNGNPYEPKSTKHLIYCEEEMDWFPITLISTLFNLKLN
ncbi:MAG: ParB N-terminal domain-containing protein [Bacteroidota bacterium]|nr:ParB N-terminal domain-containing protein [Bacteroidota bacterium]